MKEHHSFNWPGAFDFYHVGALAPSEAHFDLAGAHWLSYSIHGDGRGTLLLAFHPDQDPSLFAELGNILCARIAMTRASECDGINWISPPSEVFPENIERLRPLIHAQQTYVLTFQTTERHSKGESVPVRALWIENLGQREEILPTQSPSLPHPSLAPRERAAAVLT